MQIPTRTNINVVTNWRVLSHSPCASKSGVTAIVKAMSTRPIKELVIHCFLVNLSILSEPTILLAIDPMEMAKPIGIAIRITSHVLPPTRAVHSINRANMHDKTRYNKICTGTGASRRNPTSKMLITSMKVLNENSLLGSSTTSKKYVVSESQNNRTQGQTNRQDRRRNGPSKPKLSLQRFPYG